MATLLLKNISIKKSSIEIGNVPFHIPFIIMLIINVVLLLFMISDTSIYIKEARGFFENATFPYKIANLGVSLCMYLALVVSLSSVSKEWLSRTISSQPCSFGGSISAPGWAERIR